MRKGSCFCLKGILKAEARLTGLKQCKMTVAGTANRKAAVVMTVITQEHYPIKRIKSRYLKKRIRKIKIKKIDASSSVFS